MKTILTTASLAIAGNLVATMVPGGSEELAVSRGDDDVIFDGNF